MEDYYQVLGIPRGASASLVKIAFDGKMKALDDPRFPLTPEARRAEERALKEAHVTLTMDAKRVPYDEKLDAYLAGTLGKEKGKWRNSHVAFASILVAVVALGLGAMGVERAREKDKLRIEQERLALERDRMEKQVALEEERFKDSQSRRDAASEEQRQRNEQYRVARERAEYDRWRNQTDAQIRYSERQSQSAVDTRSSYDQRYAEERARRQEQDERMAAQREVERQKQYLRQKEYEEERARVDRHNRAQQDDYERRMRQQMEEARARQASQR